MGRKHKVGDAFTPTQKRIFALLSDRKWHSREAIHGCLFDELSGPSAVRKQISHMRNILRKRGEEIATRITPTTTLYRIVIAED
jgi:hypothetical protein